MVHEFQLFLFSLVKYGKGKKVENWNFKYTLNEYEKTNL